MVVLFVNKNDFCYYRNCLYNHRYKFCSEKEHVNDFQYIVSRPDSVRIRHSGRIGNGGVTSLPRRIIASPKRTCKLCFGSSLPLILKIIHLINEDPNK